MSAIRSLQAHPADEPSTGLSVLVVEDDPDALELHARALEAADLRVHRAASAVDALIIARDVDVDVLVSDLGLPGLDGYTLLQTLRRLRPTLRDLPAMALTAHRDEEDIEEAFQAGFFMHVAKPVDPQDLVAMVTGLGRIQRAS